MNIGQRNLTAANCVLLAAFVLLHPILAAAQQGEGGPPFVKGRILVQFKPGVSPAQSQGIIASHQARSAKVLSRIGVHVLALPPSASETAVLKAFQARQEVAFAELDMRVPHEAVTPNDPYFPNQWHLPRISAPDAWSSTAGSSSVIIAILDTGVDSTHPDLAAKIVAGWNVYDNNADTSDVYGHGTKVAGTAAAITNNGAGVASVCWECRIMPVRISDPSGYALYSDAAEALNWAADHGARVANISYAMTNSSAVKAAAQYFQSKGGVVSVSAGNSALFDSTADNPYVLTVSGTDWNDVLYSWSNTGNNIDLAAPGCVDATTTRGGGYGGACGTSFSAPVVAGVAALVLSVNPSLTGDDVVNILHLSADDRGPAGWDPSYGYGRVNAARAVEMAGGGGGADTEPPSVAITSPADGAAVSGTVAIQASASDDKGVASVRFYVDGNLLSSDTAAPYSASWNTAASANGVHTLTATAADAAGNMQSRSVTVTVNNAAPDTKPPSIVILTPPNNSTVSGNLAVQASATDDKGVKRVEFYVDGVLRGSSTVAPFTIKWNTRKEKAGAHVLQEKAYDAAGNAGVSSVVTVYK